MVAPLIMLLLVSGCTSKQTDYPSPDVQGAPNDAPFKYHGKMLQFPAGTVDGRIDETQNPYARLIPKGEITKSIYFIDLGRPSTGTVQHGLRWLGFLSFSEKSASTDLGGGYSLWCEGDRQEVRSCAVLLRELPLAAVNFVIGEPKGIAQAKSAVAEAESYLRRAKSASK